jgi:hypothetical protein
MSSAFEATAVVSRRGVLDESGKVAEYYTSHPTPTHGLRSGSLRSRAVLVPWGCPAGWL